ncbi:MAG: sulfatase-like hydrolase/transferase, partial [Planctomycetota bacterium]
GKKYFSPYDNPRLTDGPDGEHLPDRLATEAAQFIADHKTQPFLTYLSFYSVHTPLMARKDLKQKYEDLKSRVRIAGPIWGREEPRKFRLVQEHAVYAAMVTAMDEAVGKVIDELEKNDLLESTMILFTSDNGGLSTSEGHPTTNLPLRAGKGWIYEGGIRVPTIVHVPGLTRPDSVCDTPISSVDYFPTVLDLAGISNENLGLDGESILPLLRGESQARKPIYWHYPHYGNQGGSPSAAIRDGEWKLIQWLETGQYSLYNLSKDTGEQNDLVDDHPDVVQALSEKLQEWQKDVGAKPLTRRVK